MLLRKTIKFLKQNKGFPHKMVSRRGVQRPKVCNCRQTHFWKKIKMILKKVSLTTVAHFRHPQGRPIEKRVSET